MAEPNHDSTALWIALLAVGMGLNTIGIVLQDAGVIRYLIMGTGLLLILICVMNLLRTQQKKPD